MRPHATSASTVIAGGRLACASTATRRARSFALSDRVATPSMRTSPACGRNSPSMSLIIVDFPQPFGPTTLVTAPWGSAALSPSMNGSLP